MTLVSSDLLAVDPLSGRIGAEVTGLRLGGAGAGLDPETMWALRQVILEHRVVFLRGQHHLDVECHQGFARLLGPLTLSHPSAWAQAGGSRIFSVDSARGGRASHWHSDVTFAAAPPAFSVLRALRVPPCGGDTLWANTVAAYRSLPAALRAMVEEVWARHSNRFDHDSKYGPDGPGRAEETAHFQSAPFVADHPVVQVHPETDERAILLGGHALSLRGVSRRDSEHLYNLVQDAVTRPENTVRWRWRAGDVAIWDNRSTQHYALNDYGDFPRLMHRVTVAGEIPVGVDGRRSVQVEGDTTGCLAG